MGFLIIAWDLQKRCYYRINVKSIINRTVRMDIRDSPTGQIIKTLKGYHAFVPNPLPPTIEWTSSCLLQLSKADQMMGMLSLEGKKLHNPYILTKPFMTREAVLSSRIEGTRASVSDVFESDVRSKQAHDEDLQEVKNYITALQFALERMNELPLSLRLIREIHEKLMRGVRGDYATPGEFRRSQNWIGPVGSTINTAKYVPPPVEEMQECLKSFEEFLHDESLPPLIHAALCHYQFEALHPFLDGNGRVGRLLIILLLIKRNVLGSPLLYLSDFFESTRNDYYDHLYSVSAHGTWEGWLSYFLEGVYLQASDALNRAEKINGLIESWRIEVGSSLTHIDQVIKSLSENPYVTVNSLKETYGVAYTTAARLIEKLMEHKIIRPTNDVQRSKVFCAYEILKVIEAPSPKGVRCL